MNTHADRNALLFAIMMALHGKENLPVIKLYEALRAEFPDASIDDFSAAIEMHRITGEVQTRFGLRDVKPKGNA